MRRSGILVAAVVGVILLAWLIQFAPGSWRAIFEHPIRVVIGSGQELNASLLDVSENTEPVRAASRTLLKPLGMVRLTRVFPPAETSTKDKASNGSKRP